MGNRDSITADAGPVEAARQDKEARGETWSEWIRAAREARTDSTQDESTLNSLSQDAIDDIGAEVERRVERALETASRRQQTQRELMIDIPAT
ncbi:hypothetical protein JT689_01450 (plasmid) [Halobacterium sp. GSL-19]|uniref:hypothetical protein n=1 Tax=Halobacterium sp. GSL-19 TaxID=2812551 RepID=UPI001965A1B2|nr:hypothetical protein [Halobacterium sp. GSL-19]QRY21755.1 hypothetical protein JT689_01450 [Halobacterium sp. GSL-19]